MTDANQYGASIRALITQVQKRFGPDAFIVQTFFDPSVIGFRSATSKHTYYSIVTTNQREGFYSVQITLEGPEFQVPAFVAEGKQFYLPCEIAFDGVVAIEELLGLFEKYMNT